MAAYQAQSYESLIWYARTSHHIPLFGLDFQSVIFHFAGIGYAFKQVVCTRFLEYVLIGNELYFIV